MWCVCFFFVCMFIFSFFFLCCVFCFVPFVYLFFCFVSSLVSEYVRICTTHPLSTFNKKHSYFIIIITFFFVFCMSHRLIEVHVHLSKINLCGGRPYLFLSHILILPAFDIDNIFLSFSNHFQSTILGFKQARTK